MMRVGKLSEQVEVLLKVRRGVAERGKDKNALLVRVRFRGGFDVVEVNMRNCALVYFYWTVVIEYHWCLEVAVPF